MNVTPYVGNDPYIFISYAHKDREQNPVVDKIINYLKLKGFRVWFDDDIIPASEWDEKIATQVMECSYFIALMSRKYLKSSNCKDELKYSRSLEKKQLIIYLEECKLPPGIEMRTNRMQSLFQYKYETFDAFTSKLEEADGIEICRESVYSDYDSDTSYDDSYFEDFEEEREVDGIVSHVADMLFNLSGESEDETEKPLKKPLWYRMLFLFILATVFSTGMLFTTRPLWRYAVAYEESMQIPAYQTLNSLVNIFWIIHWILWIVTAIYIVASIVKFRKKNVVIPVLISAVVVVISILNFFHADVASSYDKCTEKIMVFMCDEALHNRIMSNETGIYDCEVMNFPREKIADYVYGDFFYGDAEYVVLTRNNTKQWDMVTLYMDLPDDVFAIYLPTKNLRHTSVSGMYGG